MDALVGVCFSLSLFFFWYKVDAIYMYITYKVALKEGYMKREGLEFILLFVRVRWLYSPFMHLSRGNRLS